MGGEYKIDGDLNIMKSILILYNELFAPIHCDLLQQYPMDLLQLHCRQLQLTEMQHTPLSWL